MSNVMPCPSCQRQLALPENAAGKLVRCPDCQNTFTVPLQAEAVRPIWEKPPDDERSRPRRRYEETHGHDFDEPLYRRGVPHRGGAVLALGILSMIVFPCAPVLGPIAWVIGNADLREMALGRMDRTGEGTTQAGKILGSISTIVSLIVIGLWCLGAIAMVGERR